MQVVRIDGDVQSRHQHAVERVICQCGNDSRLVIAGDANLKNGLAFPCKADNRWILHHPNTINWRGLLQNLRWLPEHFRVSPFPGMRVAKQTFCAGIPKRAEMVRQEIHLVPRQVHTNDTGFYCPRQAAAPAGQLSQLAHAGSR